MIVTFFVVKLKRSASSIKVVIRNLSLFIHIFLQKDKKYNEQMILIAFILSCLDASGIERLTYARNDDNLRFEWDDNSSPGNQMQKIKFRCDGIL